MSSLLGIALVVDDISKGCNLAFRYPAPPSATDSVSSFHKLSPALFAKLFRPKNALCNQSFELVVDDLRFVSHPVLVSRRAHAAPVGAASTTAATSLANNNSNNNANASSRNETTMFNVVFALEELAVHGVDAHADDELEARRRRSISAFRTVAAQLANGLLHEELRVGFVSHEVRELLHMRDELAQHERQNVAAAASAGPSGASGAHTTTTNSNSTSASSTNNNNHGASSSSSTNTAANAHTLSASSTTTTITTIHRKNDNTHNNHNNSTNDTQTTGANSAATNHTRVDVDPQTFLDVALEKSVLANDLKRVFHGLDDAGAAHVVLNHWVKLALTLTDAVTIQMAQLRPYHTLLLLVDDAQIIASLPRDHSQQLRRLIAAANPLQSFQELALVTSIPIHQVFRLAAHLVFWGYGKVIATITLRNLYHVHPLATVDRTSALALAFRQQFPPHELADVLARFAGARAIAEHMKHLSAVKKTEFIHMLIWLLQQNFIVQLHRYVYFMIPLDERNYNDYDHAGGDDNSSYGSNRVMSFTSPPTSYRSDAFLSSALSFNPLLTPPPATATATANASVPVATAVASYERPLQQPQANSAYEAELPVATIASSALTSHERAYLDRIATTDPVYALFKRLCVYFHGQYHLEEIMWRENVSRSELRTVLSTYQDVIVCCLHA